MFFQYYFERNFLEASVVSKMKAHTPIVYRWGVVPGTASVLVNPSGEVLDIKGVVVTINVKVS